MMTQAAPLILAAIDLVYPAGPLQENLRDPAILAARLARLVAPLGAHPPLAPYARALSEAQAALASRNRVLDSYETREMATWLAAVGGLVAVHTSAQAVRHRAAAPEAEPRDAQAAPCGAAREAQPC